MRPRIQTLDGLRFLAALGVLWIHAWGMWGARRYYIGSFDLANVLALGGNGVDLFFVISGFCMYYFYASKTDFSSHDFFRFLFKRWMRLSPAFYTATVIYALTGHNVNLINLLNSVFYLNSIFQQFNVASHFWTLGVEWQFYLVIPFLLLYQNRLGFKKVFVIIFGTLFLSALISVFVVKNKGDLLTNQILFRGIEFGCGVVAARFLIMGISVKRRPLWLLFLICVTYAGRVLISKPVLHLSVDYHNLFKLGGFSLMGCGFAGILYLSVTSTKWLALILGNRVFKVMGKISYSFYLWHGLVLPVVVSYLTNYLPPDGMMGPVLATCISTLVLYPLSQLSYNLLEKPFLSIGNLTTK